jgi:hypothetical protein
MSFSAQAFVGAEAADLQKYKTRSKQQTTNRKKKASK